MGEMSVPMTSQFGYSSAKSLHGQRVSLDSMHAYRSRLDSHRPDACIENVFLALDSRFKRDQSNAHLFLCRRQELCSASQGQPYATCGAKRLVCHLGLVERCKVKLVAHRQSKEMMATNRQIYKFNLVGLGSILLDVPCLILLLIVASPSCSVLAGC